MREQTFVDNTGTRDPTGEPRQEQQVAGLVYYVHVLYLGKSDRSMQQKTCATKPSQRATLLLAMLLATRANHRMQIMTRRGAQSEETCVYTRMAHKLGGVCMSGLAYRAATRPAASIITGAMMLPAALVLGAAVSVPVAEEVPEAVVEAAVISLVCGHKGTDGRYEHGLVLQSQLLPQ